MVRLTQTRYKTGVYLTYRAVRLAIIQGQMATYSKE